LDTKPNDMLGGHLSATGKAIEGDPRGELIQRFLRIGPYWSAANS
jgi:hypothetical protein